MPKGAGPYVYTIPAHRPFADALAAGLLARHRAEPLGLARGILLVPNGRAARALTDAFVRRAEGGLLLPRLVVIGDPELDERLGSALDPIGSGELVPPAIEPLERRLRLANLVQQVRARRGQTVRAAEALRLAGDLARALDQLIVERIAPDRIFNAIDPDLSEHWQSSLDEIEIVLKLWPEELARIGKIDLAERRNRLLDKVARRWSETPPPGFVVAAGITTPAPAMAAVQRAVSRMTGGMVVLPALDLDMPEEEWRALGPFEPDPEIGFARRSIETHPQFQFKLLLDRIGVARAEVRRWRHGGGRAAPAVRARAIGNAMAPAEFTGKWCELARGERRLSGVRAVELAHPAEEAQTVALALREAIETPGRTAALVTPDRGLARRVSAHLERWGIAADDSAGRPLAETPAGTLLLALADAAAARFAPVQLLALLKHPLARAGEERLAWLDEVRRLDRALRGPRPAAGLEGVERHLTETDRSASLLSWWRETATLLEPLETAFATERGQLAKLLAAVRDAATALAGDAAWAGADGRAAAGLIADLERHASAGPPATDPADLPPLLETLAREVAVRPPQGGHPRIFIWGLLEARLQQTDLMVLSGLNEGVWPDLPSPDPWLAPKVRAAVGLPGLERRIGLAAHDFASALGAPQVLVTRARRDARGPAVASRFWLRLAAMTGGVTRAPRLKAWARTIDRAEGPPTPATRPAPAPPVAERPTSISVTQLDRLKADPFAFYASKLLGLSRLDPVDADPSPAWRGQAVHEILEAWFREDDFDPEKLRPRAEALLRDGDAHPLTRALWEPRLLAAIDWVANEMAANREEGRTPLRAEVKGEATIAGIRLNGRADRIDRLADGRLAVVDYKTGQSPSPAQIEEGFAMQLGLLGLILENGGFEEMAGEAGAFEYWSFARDGDSFGKVATPFRKKGGRLEADNFTAESRAVFSEAAARWLTGEGEFKAKLHPEYAPYDEYDQLMRLEEWLGRGDD